MTDWTYRISRDKLIRRLYGSSKLPADFSGAFYQMALPSYDGPGPIPGFYTLKVYPSKRRDHRTYVLCSCGKEIPTGRFHQHKGACK